MSDQPNLLLITTDQMRGDCLGVAGHPAVMTPNLDNWFNEGAFFPRAYSECPSCIPARRTLITGQSPYRQGLPGYRDQVPFFPETTMMHELAAAGYHNFCSGKMHFTPQRKHHGFHQMVLHEGRQRFGDYVDDYEEWLKARTEVGERDHGVDSNSWIARPYHLSEHLHQTNWVVDQAIELLKRRDPDRPFFLWVSFLRPHAPLDPPQVYWDMYADEDLPKPAVGDWCSDHDVPTPLDPNAWQGRLPERLQHRAQVGYYACITHIDQQIGRLFEELRKMRLLNDTFSVMTADHGEMLGDHHLWRKTFAYEGSARVPFLVRVPRNWGTQRRALREEVVGLQDVMPTMLDAAGVEIPKSVEGRSVLPLLRGDSAWRPWLHGEHATCYAEDEAMQFLTDGNVKYIWFPKTGREQLFDLTRDPQELHDLAPIPAEKERLDIWRSHLAEQLAGRKDALSDGGELVTKTVTCDTYLNSE